jgi:hypothetical protein
MDAKEVGEFVMPVFQDKIVNWVLFIREQTGGIIKENKSVEHQRRTRGGSEVL